jgi:hypothetical protein
MFLFLSFSLAEIAARIWRSAFSERSCSVALGPCAHVLKTDSQSLLIFCSPFY